MIIARVSNIAAFARWKEDEDSSVDWLINSILSNEQTEAMAKGTAFHKHLEHAKAGLEVDQISIDGYSFAFTADFEITLPPMREWRKRKDYGGIIVTGQCDGMVGNTIIDHKTTERFDAEKYLDGWQWRFYLSIFGADRFVWNVWEMNELKEPKSYGVHHLHKLEQFRYPAMEEDCTSLALEYREFAMKHMPQLDVAA